MKRVIIIGATSGIGRGLAELFAKEDHIVGLIGRREKLLMNISLQHPDTYFYKVCDITKANETILQLEILTKEIGGMDILIICSGVGELNPTLNFELEQPTILTNVLGFTSIADWGFKYFESQEQGQLVAITSIGGIRGSGEAPAYNASKAYQINYMEGLRQKAAKLSFHIHITDIRPGFVDTAMAKGEGLFWITPLPKAVNQIYKSILKKKKIVFVSKRWRYIALLLKILPTSIYCKI